jgi:hypothetical protein
MPRDSVQGRLVLDFPAQPFDSAPRLLGRSAAFFFVNLPVLAAVTLAVMIPGNLLVQLFCYLLDVPADGVLSYVLLEIGDLVFGALAIGAVIYTVTGKLRTGRAPALGESLRWARRIWLRMLWNQFKMEMTVGLWSLLIFIPGLMALVRLFLVQPVAALEPDSPDPLRRSEELTRGVRWRVFFVALPLLAIDLFGSFVILDALPGAGHSRLLLALSDSVLAVAGQWTTVAAVLIYVGQASRPAHRPKAGAATASPGPGNPS